MFKNGFFVFWFVLSAFMSTVSSAAVPELIDLNLIGPKEGAYFEPDTLELIEGDNYLLVISNPYDRSYDFKAPTFAGAIVTQYIQGSPSVTQSSVTIAPNSKVQWLFRVTKSGQHFFEARTQGMQDHKRKAGIIKLRSLVPQSDIPPALSQQAPYTSQNSMQSNTVVSQQRSSEVPNRLANRRVGGKPG